MTDSNHKPALPGFALSAGMLWLLVGALYKLFDGSPNDLPKIVTDMSPLGSNWETMRAAIIVELAVVGLVIAKPRLGWLFLVATFGTFLAILYPLVQEGAASCGCFGSSLTVKPETMMAVDGGLLVLILISRPWRMAKDSGLGWAGYLPLLAVAIAGPIMKLPAPTLPPLPKKPDIVAPTSPETTKKNEAVAPPEEGTTIDPGTELKPVKPEDGGPNTGAAAKPPEETTGTDVTVDVPPIEPTSDATEFAELVPADWEGKDFYETDLARYVDQSQGAVLPGSHVVVYRQTCEVCQEHLEQLWEEGQNDPTKWSPEHPLVLIRVIENNDTEENNKCKILPSPHQMVTLPALKRGYGITTPTTFDVDEAFMVQNVTDLSAH